LQEDGHITDPSQLATLNLALAVRSSTPRIEAHYQHYKSSIVPRLEGTYDSSCESWLSLSNKQFCEPAALSKDQVSAEDGDDAVGLDRQLDVQSTLPKVYLYADILSPKFSEFYAQALKAAANAGTQLIVRYKPSASVSSEDLYLSGYGVGLALKRTDYIVIDDRENTEEVKGKSESSQIVLEEEDIADIEPLTKSEIRTLSRKASGYILDNEKPFNALLGLTQDFPKHSAAIAAYKENSDFDFEHQRNRGKYLSSGFNYVWINGVKLDQHQVNIYSLLEHLRHERALLSNAQNLGLSLSEVQKLYQHDRLVDAKKSIDKQRYDYRDVSDGGRVVIWLNDLENDVLYSEWPREISGIFQRAYPQLFPLLARDIHNVVVPVDLGKPEDLDFLLNQVYAFSTRKIPVRFGFVPTVSDSVSAEQAQVAYHLFETYGVDAMIKYLLKIAGAAKVESPKTSDFDSVSEESEGIEGKEDLSLSELLSSETAQKSIVAAQKWGSRLQTSSEVPPVFVNGVALRRSDSWVQSMIQRISLDIDDMKAKLAAEEYNDDTYMPEHYLNKSSPSRNTLVIPEDESQVSFADIDTLSRTFSALWESLPTIEADDEADKALWGQLVVIGDFDREDGYLLLSHVEEAIRDTESLDLVILHNADAATEKKRFSKQLYALQQSQYLTELSKLKELLDDAPPPEIKKLSAQSEMEFSADEKPTEFWKSTLPILKELGLAPGQRALIFNGRIISIPAIEKFDIDDVKQLLQYEQRKRTTPVYEVLVDLDLLDKIDSATTFAKLSYYASISDISGLPEAIFETSSNLREGSFKLWEDQHTSFESGDKDTATFHIVVSLDPVSEIAQRWAPLLKILSEIDGIYVKVFLNPTDYLQELPIKRFYRHVLNSKPIFNGDGSISSPKALFTGLPKDALLTAGLDTPPSWLVAPKNSVYDLDNIKLSSLKDRSSVIRAVYELEHILIEGHSRDLSKNGAPPRGVQVVLGTPEEPHFADTLIMANLGYFQFKANPGYWNMTLQKGRSQDVFELVSAGGLGYSPTFGDDTSLILLDSFQGKTLFPRLKRKAGQEAADVLDETGGTTAGAVVNKGKKLASQVLSNVGLGGPKEHADINIFSVASGHLYERMLNIMMVSVMKNTKHTVKFWFIEQFLSPSFKVSSPIFSSSKVTASIVLTFDLLGLYSTPGSSLWIPI
jgi:UDP-glucose:glycoprotein glucosyltransferase